jgi:hypothetical protein
VISAASRLDPTAAALLSILVSAVSTAILRWAAWRWPTDYHRRGSQRNRRRKPPPDSEPDEG